MSRVFSPAIVPPPLMTAAEFARAGKMHAEIIATTNLAIQAALANVLRRLPPPGAAGFNDTDPSHAVAENGELP